MEPESGKKSRGIKVQSDLFCKSGCGFYGNSNWQGYCSKCWKDRLQQPSKSENVSRSPKSSPFARHRQSSPSGSFWAVFSRFEEKRSQQHEKRTRTMKSLFKKSHQSPSRDFSSVPFLEEMLDGVTGSSASSENTPSSDAFTEYLKTLSKPIAIDVLRHINSVTQKMQKMCEAGASPEELSDTAKEFYQSLNDRLRNHPTFGEATSEQLESMMDFTEKNVMTRLYKSVFFALSAQNEDKDLEIQKRIRSLNWISAAHLDCFIDELRPDIMALIDKAIFSAIEMDARRAPQDKLSCIVKCSKNIFEILRVSRERFGNVEAASADEFLPALIFIVLRANPPRLHSNINYIDKFCNPGRLLSGEAGYYFTNLCCAVEFIEKMNHESLNLTKDEFDRFMSGEALPPGVVFGANLDSLEAPWLCEGVRIMRGNLVTLNELASRDTKLEIGLDDLITDGATFVDGVEKMVDDVMAGTPLTSQPHKRPIALDDAAEATENLPPPLTPQILK
ncbi:unnamed protein product [Notodromas monacha]|uniref:Rab5 GDP/GTP exchange factor n=1 Tax=Notodromas monacha TaxID=399045 RepID=A0A7R9BCU7_9CRUS|nr:unnamed protein product [Notodromas monacha]CAG0912947.1 unnamed protein product [Notodromas monacha]